MVISGFILPCGAIIFAPTITCNLIKQTDALPLSLYPGQRLLNEIRGWEHTVWDDFPTPFYTLCPDWLEMWRDTLSSSLLMDFIEVSLHSLLLFLLTVFFPLFSLSSYSSYSQNWNDIMPRGTQAESVPTRPCRRTRDQWQEGYLLNRRMM